MRDKWLNLVRRDPAGICTNSPIYYQFNSRADKYPFQPYSALFKTIRLINSFRELGDDLALGPTYASKIFAKNIPILASVLRPCIVKLDNKMNKIRFRKILIDD